MAEETQEVSPQDEELGTEEQSDEELWETAGEESEESEDIEDEVEEEPEEEETEEEEPGHDYEKRYKDLEREFHKRNEDSARSFRICGCRTWSLKGRWKSSKPSLQLRLIKDRQRRDQMSSSRMMIGKQWTSLVS